jgi:transposase
MWYHPQKGGYHIMKTTKVTKDEMEIFVSLYKNGMSIKDIALKYKRNYKTVSNVLYGKGINPHKLWMEGLRKKKTTLFNHEQDKIIGGEYLSGMSLKKLARKYSCCLAAIVNSLKREKIDRKPRGATYMVYDEKETKNIIKLYTINNMSQNKIAIIYNTSQVTISRILRQNGVERKRMSGSKHVNWKGGRVRQSGYIFILLSTNHKYRCMAQKEGYVAEHRLVMAENLGRPLKKSETVHHINGEKEDNRIENLELRQGKHGRGICYRCADCGSRNIVEVNLD